MYRMSLWNYLYSIGSAAFFLALMLVNIVDSNIVTIVWYSVCAFCTILGLISIYQKCSVWFLLFFAICVISSLLCYRLINNLSLMQYIFVIICPLIASMLVNTNINPLYLKVVIFIDATYIATSYMAHGIQGQLFLSSSTNFVSVFLLYPTVVYYSKVDLKKQKTDIATIVVVWFLCILARGRGGMLTSSFLLVAILLNAYYEKPISRRNRIVYGIAIVIILLFLIMIIISSSDIWLKWGAFEYFNNRGLESSSRLGIWDEYLTAVSSNKNYMLWGAPFSELYIQVTRIHGNLHNSFLNVHAYNGLIMLILVIFYILRTIKYGIKSKNYLFLACFITLCVRGFTDNVFWGAYGTPAFLYFLFIPFDITVKRQNQINDLRRDLLDAKMRYLIKQ